MDKQTVIELMGIVQICTDERMTPLEKVEAINEEFFISKKSSLAKKRPPKIDSEYLKDLCMNKHGLHGNITTGFTDAPVKLKDIKEAIDEYHRRCSKEKDKHLTILMEDNSECLELIKDFAVLRSMWEITGTTETYLTNLNAAFSRATKIVQDKL